MKNCENQKKVPFTTFLSVDGLSPVLSCSLLRPSKGGPFCDTLESVILLSGVKYRTEVSFREIYSGDSMLLPILQRRHEVGVCLHDGNFLVNENWALAMILKDIFKTLFKEIAAFIRSLPVNGSNRYYEMTNGSLLVVPNNFLGLSDFAKTPDDSGEAHRELVLTSTSSKYEVTR